MWVYTTTIRLKFLKSCVAKGHTKRDSYVKLNVNLLPFGFKMFEKLVKKKKE